MRAQSPTTENRYTQAHSQTCTYAMRPGSFRDAQYDLLSGQNEPQKRETERKKTGKEREEAEEREAQKYHSCNGTFIAVLLPPVPVHGEIGRAHV